MTGLKRVFVVLTAISTISIADNEPWWDGGFIGELNYRFLVDVTNGRTPKEDYPITLSVNFTQKLLEIGEVGALDEGSIRIVRQPSDSATGLWDTISYLFEKSPDYGFISKAKGWLSWIVSGTVSPQETVRFHVYFDLQKHGIKPEEVPLPWETVIYSPWNKVLGASLEPEAVVTDASKNCWRGWGAGGSRPDTLLAYEEGHWGRWSLALVPGSSSRYEALIGLLERDTPYILGCYYRTSRELPAGTNLTASFLAGGRRQVEFSKAIPLDGALGWRRAEIPLPSASESTPFSLTLTVEGASVDTLWLDDLFIFEDPPIISESTGEKLP
jgi:hypothetical protein